MEKYFFPERETYFSILNSQFSIKKEPRNRFQLRSFFCVLPSAFASVPADKNFLFQYFILLILNKPLSPVAGYFSGLLRAAN